MEITAMWLEYSYVDKSNFCKSKQSEKKKKQIISFHFNFFHFFSASKREKPIVF